MSLDLKIIGGALLCGAVALDTVIRFRMKRIGYKWAFLRGGTFDYGQYLKVRANYGWSPWLVYLFWATLVPGLFLFVLGSIPR